VSDRVAIVIADDHPLFRGGLGALLGSVADTEVVGEATTGEEAIALARTLRPDVVVMDLTMPGIGGIEATRRIVSTAPDVHVLVMTMHEDDDAVFAALRAGARGYLLKGAQQAETLRAIRAVANGEVILGPALAERLQRFLAVPQTADPADAFPQLTERELDVLELLARRSTNAEIAAALFLSQKTVRNYVSGILAKLQVADRAEARQLARAAGIGGVAPGQAPQPAPAPGRPDG
jgi:DNA-binding NarL/FixJ family response regulator